MKIPKNLDEAIEALTNMLHEAQVNVQSKNGYGDRSELDIFMSKTEEQLSGYHHDLGRWLRNNWKLWATGLDKGALVKLFNKLGITHADDMSGIIIDSTHRHLHEKDIDLDGQVKHYQDYWTKMKNTMGG